MKLYHEAVEKAGGKNEGVKVRALTPCEKRIITTKAVANCHAKLTGPTRKTYSMPCRAFGNLSLSKTRTDSFVLSSSTILLSMRQRLLFGWHSKGLSWTFQSTLVPLTQLLARLQNHRKLSLTR